MCVDDIILAGNDIEMIVAIEEWQSLLVKDMGRAL